MIFMRFCTLLQIIFLTLCILFSLISCVSAKKAQILSEEAEAVSKIDDNKYNSVIDQEAYQSEQPLPPSPPKDTILLTFAGDIMAHTNVTRMENFSLIYADITPITLHDSLTFANLETPVYSDKPYENYPTFNVQSPFADEAVKAGFDVFSLANNHTNDQGKTGILKTYEYFQKKRNDGVFSAGIKNESSSSLTYDVITKDGFTILFAAFTEILNTYTLTDYIDYIGSSNTAREILKKQIISMREKNPCDLFILSIHSNEPEYVIQVEQERRQFYYDLLDCGVDIVWANHPHVLREWEILVDTQTGLGTKAVFYGLGNTISGQRYIYNFDNPSSSREYTGDGMLFQIEFTKEDQGKPYISDTKKYLITTHIDEQKNSVIKILNEDFIYSQEKKYTEYYAKRFELIENIKGTTLCR